ncbi:sensor histidine kinase [Saccharophagus degradans]|uniref:Sensor histidine kinase n=1 Tax=Saccharophagus degradans TaxID=86304 RepID=A0AAW7XAL2_9GAMM|nr:sensor histidine kinase [Saccharophagus degradans]MBU2987102.1 sensor histidine kinase [Saccharophagus degradans]MDO6423803.1 sensor histidine kinase [Saccharophagus degradans]MDO6607883.1 sensor histidine kinase [Saccharophagus degradans]
MASFIEKLERSEGPWLAFTRRHYQRRRPPRWIFASLSFSLFYFFPLIFDSSVTTTRLLAGVATYAVFVFCYFQIAFSSLRVSLLYLLAMVIICLVTPKISTGTSTLIGYCGFFIGYYFRLAIGLALYVLLLTLFGLSSWFFDLFNYWVIPSGVLLTTGLFFLAAMSRAEDIARYKDHRSNEKIEQLAIVAERERIARDLHDILGHTLTSIVLKSQLAEKLCAAGQTAQGQKEIGEVSRIASEALSELRQTVSGYKAKTMEQLLNKLSDRLVDKGIVTEVECDLSGLPPKTEAALSLILTEAVTNILRHSNATRAKIYTHRENKIFTLTVQDNGTVSQAQQVQCGNGLQGIRERVEELQGKFVIDTSEGFMVQIQLQEQAQ